jgi:hypothetical protein
MGCKKTVETVGRINVRAVTRLKPGVNESLLGLPTSLLGHGVGLVAFRLARLRVYINREAVP